METVSPELYHLLVAKRLKIADTLQGENDCGWSRCEKVLYNWWLLCILYVFAIISECLRLDIVKPRFTCTALRTNWLLRLAQIYVK